MHGVLVIALVAGAMSPADVRTAARKVLDDSSYQKSLPGPTPDAVPEQPFRERAEDTDLQPPGGTGSFVARGLMWVIIAVAVALLAFWLYSELRGFPQPDAALEAGEPAPEAEGKRSVLERPLGDAEALAAAGRYGEAIHVLLLRTLEALVRRAGLVLPRSLTSREILASVSLDGRAREALGGLVHAVELSHFGGATPGADEYGACVARFRAFAEAYAP